MKLAPFSHSEIQAAVLQALHNATYSASVVNVDVVFCFQLDHVTASPVCRNTFPCIEHQSEMSPA